MTSCSWNSDQNLLATCSQDKVVQLWSISQNNVELQTTFSCITRLRTLVSVVFCSVRLLLFIVGDDLPIMPGVLKFIIVTLWYEARLVTHCQNVYFIQRKYLCFSRCSNIPRYFWKYFIHTLTELLLCFNFSFLWLSPFLVRQIDQAVRGPVDVITCLLCTGAQGATFWLLQRTNT